MIHELYDMAGQHDMIADNLNADIMAKLLTCIQELKQDRKKVGSVSLKFNFAFNFCSLEVISCYLVSYFHACGSYVIRVLAGYP